MNQAPKDIYLGCKMPKLSLMKRLSKSATDLSNCTRKTRSTSDENFEQDKGAQAGAQTSEDEDIASGVRPGSAQSSSSVPTISLLGRGSQYSGKFRARSRSQHSRTESVSRERSIAAEIEAVQKSSNYGIFGLLKQKFRLSSRERHNQHQHQQHDHTGDTCRQHLPQEEGRDHPPEIIRIRYDSETNPNYQADNESYNSGESARNSPRTQILKGQKEDDDQSPSHPSEVGLEGYPHPSPPASPHPPPLLAQTSILSSNGRQDSRSSFMSLLSRHKGESMDGSGGGGGVLASEISASPALEAFHSTEDLQDFSKFYLYVHLRQGHDLPAKDSCGTSDPYVKFYYGNKMMYKTKTIYKDLNPFWDENFYFTLDSLIHPLELKVFDYDWGMRDDFIGSAILDLKKLALNHAQDHVLTLTDSGHTTYLGQLSLNLKLVPVQIDSSIQKNVSAISHSLTHSNTPSPSRGLDLVSRKIKPGTWSAVVNIVLVEGSDLLAMDVEGTSDPYCKFRLGNDRFKSKAVYQTLRPKWYEMFDLYLYDDFDLEITVWDKDQRSKDDFMGRGSIDLSSLASEVSHQLWVNLEDGAGKLFIILTVSGITGPESPSFLNNWDEVSSGQKEFYEEFSWRNTLKNIENVGILVVKVFRAKGLYAADLGGSSDPFCVLELDNTRVTTHTEYKTLDPSWQKVFTLKVKDVHSVLHITVFDEDKNHKAEFLGRIAVPLLKMINHQKTWFALKDKKLRSRAKGNCPQIQLEFHLEWNLLRATITTLNPREKLYREITEKFKRQVFINNVMRIKAVILDIMQFGKFIQSCLEWENTCRSITAFLVFMIITFYFQPYMVPVGLLLVFLKHYLVTSYIEHKFPEREESYQSEDDDDLDEKEEEKEEKKSFKEKLQAIQEVTAMVQNALGYVAGLAEAIKNTFNFSVPYLSWLAVVILSIISVVLYFIPLRVIIMLWGVNKFSKKLIRPNTVTNNELMDFLSRVPHDEMILDNRELRLATDMNQTQQKRVTVKKKVKQS